MTVELIQTEDTGRTLRCTGCGFHGIPTYEHGQPVLRCPYCREEPAKVGRNDPCLCGSGVKYKKCCLA